MKYYALVLMLLLACTQVEQTAPTSLVISVCEKRATGEACGCGCLEPATCIQGTCLMTNLEDGEGCIDDKQCLSSDCKGKCTRESTIYDCEQKCHRDSEVECYTNCKDFTYMESRQ